MSGTCRYDKLIDWLEERLVPVGFSRDDVALPSKVPDKSGLWKSDYALLLLWPLLSAIDESELKKSLALARDIMDKILTKIEEDHLGRMDGYIIVSLPSEPNSDIKNLVHSQELDTWICRMHFVWLDNNDWARQERVSVLTLQAKSTGVTDIVLDVPSNLEETEKALLERLNVDSAKKIAEDLIAQVSATL
ncbi:hypothetical protein CCP2SC5_490009 [Azospirillaceae bacterium]